jgi:DNA-binding NtrC family response regulator
VRVLAATHRDLEQLVREGKFREDLFYRLNVVVLRIPPLRERAEDIAELARHFLARHAERFGIQALRVPDELLARLCAHSWPGNVRELENAIESLVVLSPPGELELGLLSFADMPRERESKGESQTAAVSSLTLKQRMDAYERGLIVEALRASGNNRSLAAQRLGISRVTLHDKLNKHGISRQADDESG